MSRSFLPATLVLAFLNSAAFAEIPLRVTAQSVTLQEEEAALILTGIIEAGQQVQAAFPSGGQVLSILVEAGEQVKEGALLAQMDPTQAQEALLAAQAQLLAAQASLTRAEQEIERDRQLNRAGYLSKVVLDYAEQSLISTRALRDQAKTQVDTAAKALQDTRLLATSDALVIKRNAEAGQVVAPAQSVVELASLTGREAVFVAPSGYLLGDLIGREIDLTTVEPPKRQLKARLYYVSPMIDPNTGGVIVKAKIKDESDSLALKEPVSGAFPLPLGKVASLPAQALSRSGKGPALWLISNEGKVYLQPVEVARYSSDLIYLSAGLEGGETVVIKGSHLLYPGRPVEIIPEPQL